MRRISYITAIILSACAGPVPGPDKQFEGSLAGAVTGAGAGAVTGFHVASATGPGAFIGAGFGAVAGGIQGAVKDSEEDHLLALGASTQKERRRSVAQETLSDQAKRRLELHPNREIYPADLFFFGDEVVLKPSGLSLVEELARLNQLRVPSSRLAVAVYAKSRDQDSRFAVHLTEQRAKEIVNHLVRFGIDPRRLEARPVVLDQALLIDPHDDPLRYNSAVELILLDR